MIKYSLLLYSLVLLICVSCIKDDLIDDSVPPQLRIMSAIDTIAVDTTFQMVATYFNNIGVPESADLVWESSDTEVLTIDSGDGVITPVALGNSTISVRLMNGGNSLFDMHEVIVGENTSIPIATERTGLITTTSSYELTGSFILRQDGDGVVLEFAGDYQASTALPGLFVYLTNNPSTTSGAHEIGPVEVFAGAHSYTIPDVGINDYSHVLYFCAPFNVKVGDGEIQ